MKFIFFLVWDGGLVLRFGDICIWKNHVFWSFPQSKSVKISSFWTGLPMRPRENHFFFHLKKKSWKSQKIPKFEKNMKFLNVLKYIYIVLENSFGSSYNVLGDFQAIWCWGKKKSKKRGHISTRVAHHQDYR